MTQHHPQDVATLHFALNYLRENGPYEHSLGICDQQLMGRLGVNYILSGFFLTWPKYSGRITFPVPHPTLSPNEAYIHSKNLWDRETEYGRNRWELLDYCLAETIKLMEQEA